jgi:hypothetical protein
MSGGDSQSIRTQVSNNYRGLFVWAAGNSSSNIDNYVATNLPNFLAVGAHDANNARASFSCYGARSVEIWAPGTNILSTVLNNSHSSTQGTSMAAPHVAGVAALLLSISPDLTGAQLKELILTGAVPITITQPQNNPGEHQSLRLNAAGALEILGAGIATVPYFEGFEETTDGDLPESWRHSGSTAVWRTTGNIVEGVTGTTGLQGNTEPRTGDRQMTRTWHQTGNFAWVLSEPVMLVEGTTYTVSFWYKAPGFPPTGAFDNFRVQVGPTRSLTGTGLNAQMIGAETILTLTNRRVPNWTRASIQYTATSNGPHFLGFQCRTIADGGFLVTIDDISITAIHNIVLSEVGTHIFPNAMHGYSPQTALDVTIENITSEPTSALNIALSGTSVDNFTLSTTTVPSIAGAGTANFTIVPNTGLAIGTHTATVTVTGENNTFAEFDVRFTVGDPTSVAVLEQDAELIVFPNPVFDGRLIVEIPDGIESTVIQIYDISGQLVLTRPMNHPRTEIDISHLPNGVYIVRVGHRSVRIIKQ